MTSPRRVLSLASAVVVALICGTAHAQVGANPQVRAAFGDVCAPAAKSTVRVSNGGKQVALGVVVGKDGWILTKHSVLKDKLKVRTADGKDHEAELLAHDVPCDLALLKIDADDLTPIEFCDSKCCKVGYWVCSPDQNNKFAAIGVVSVASRPIKNAKAQLAGPPKAWMGVQFDIEFNGVKIQDTVANSPAQKAGLKANDVILKCNGETFMSHEDFAFFVGKLPAGTELDIKVDRDEMEVDVKVTLAERPQAKKGGGGNPQDKWGSKLSERRGGFPHILTHDSIIHPDNCGGPLVNIDGKVVGVNISRSGRTESYAIPAEIVGPLVERLKKEAAKDAKE